MGTVDPVRPAQLLEGFVTLDIIQQILKVDHRRKTFGRSGLEPVQCSPRPASGRAVLNSPESILSPILFSTLLDSRIRGYDESHNAVN